MRVRLGVLLAVAGGTLSVGAADASAALEFCKRASSGRSCARLAVPLDRSGKVPGTVTLRIERRKAKHSARPPLFLIADSGDAATETFDSEAVDDLVGTEARSRDIVVMDLRGTGRSGVLDCPALRRIWRKASGIAACASKLGPRRDFYSSVDMAQDIDAVRDALGAERIAIYGVSYGTYVAQVYARSYPSRVDRLVLDSVVGPSGADAFERSSMAAVPDVLDRICGERSCRSFMRDPGGATRRLAARLDSRPLAGYVVDRRGRRRKATVDGRGLLNLAAVYPLPTGTLPAAVAAAAHGDSAPLLRAYSDLARLARAGEVVPVRVNSPTAAVAALCADTTLPWDRTTPLPERRAAAAVFAAGLPANAFAPFGRRTALDGHLLNTCREWPSSSRSVAAPGPLPDVPALLLAGGADVATPEQDARALRMLLPRAELVIVPDAGHMVVENETGCVGRAVRRFLAGGEAGRCPRFQPDRAGLLQPPPPTSLRQLSPTGLEGRRGKTVTAVQLTLIDGLRSLLAAVFLDAVGRDGEAAGRLPRSGALRGGSYVATAPGFTLRSASFVPGVRVSGSLRTDAGGRLRGRLQVSGRVAARGRLTLRRDRLRGTIAGRRVRVGFALVERALGIRLGDARAAIRAAHAARSLPPALAWPMIPDL